MDMLTGCLLTKDCIRQDYCVNEALASLTAFCDKVIVLDCGSTDGTEKLLKDRFRNEQGMGEAIVEFLNEHPEWKLLKEYKNSNGLMIWERVQAADCPAGKELP